MKSKQTTIIYISVGVILVAVSVVLAVAFGKGKQPNYDVVAVKKTDLSETVTATGATKSSDAVDLSFEVSGKVASVPVKEGTAVKKGQLLAALGSADAAANRDAARASSDAAKIALEKLKNPPEAIDLLTAKDAVAKAGDDLDKTYDDSFNSMSAAFVDFSNITTGIKNILYSNDYDSARLNLDYYADTVKIYDPAGNFYRASSDTAFTTATADYEKVLGDYKLLTRDAGEEKIAAMVSATAALSKEMSDAAKAAKTLVDRYHDVLTASSVDSVIPALVSSHQAALGGFVAQENADTSALAGSENAIAAADRTVAERTTALAKLEAGAEDIDIRAAQTRVDAANAALMMAENNIAKTALFAPFDGIVTKVSVAAGEFTGPGSPAVSVIASSGFELETDVSEIDVAKIKPGTKAAVVLDTFGDAKTMNATVVSVNAGATNVNGVNAYHVVLAFDANDPNLKTGLTANITFLTGSVKDALAVPARSIITNGDEKSVLLLDARGAAETRSVTVGISGANGLTQVLSGLAEGDKVVSFGGNQ